MGNIFLAAGIMILFVVAICMTSDFLSPASLVCESFALAYVSAIASSNAIGWNFDTHVTTCALLLIGLTFFILGSALGNKKQKTAKINLDLNSTSYINCSMQMLMMMFILQVGMLVIYYHFYQKSMVQFARMTWSDMARMRRFVSAYGDGLDVNVPMLVNQFIKIAKAVSYVNLYILMHNWALKNVMKIRNPHFSVFKSIICWISVVMYSVYSVLQSARFEIMTLIIAGLVIWYVCYFHFSAAVRRKSRNMKKAFSKVLCIVILSMALMSVIGTLVGRLASDTLFSEAFNYFGRSIQAFDESIQTGSIYSVDRTSETFSGLVKFLSQLGIVNDSDNKIYLEFISQNGISLGNTYTAIRRFYRDFNVIGVIMLPFLQGFIMTYIYQKVKNKKKDGFDYLLLIYASIAGSAFLYCYEEYFYATYISLNYIIYFAFLYLFYMCASGRIRLMRGKIVIKTMRE